MMAPPRPTRSCRRRKKGDPVLAPEGRPMLAQGAASESSQTLGPGGKEERSPGGATDDEGRIFRVRAKEPVVVSTERRLGFAGPMDCGRLGIAAGTKRGYRWWHRASGE